MSDEPGSGAPGPDEPPRTGADLARAALEQARARARERGVGNPAGGTGGSGSGGGGGRGGRARRTGRRPRADRDGRDPQPLGAAIRGLLADRGWESTASAATVMGAWDRLVGPEIAAHCRPERLVDGELVLVAESTAWATQLRLMSRALISRLAGELGPDVVCRVRVHGPTTPNWVKGPRRVPGRGPRDTYG